METFEQEEVKELQYIADVPFPADVNPRKLIITGTPGSGKSSLLKTLNGWPEEECLDISYKNWWRSQVLQKKPRELHFSLPFFGHEESFPVYDTEQLNALSCLELDVFRIPMPPPKQGRLSVDWRGRFALEFQILPAPKVYEHRKKRAIKGTHHVDQDLTLERVEEEVRVYQSLALLFHRSGWNVYTRDDYNGIPKRFIEKIPAGDGIEVLYADLVRKQELYAHMNKLQLRQQILSRSWSHRGNRELIDFFTEILPRIMDAERCSIFIHDKSNAKVWLQSGTSLEKKQIEVPKSGSIVGEVITTGKPVVMHDLNLVQGVHTLVDANTGFVTLNMLCVPIKSITSPDVAGAIQILNKQGDVGFDKADLAMLERVAHHLELAIENIFLSQEMMDFSMLLTYQATQHAWMTRPWAITLWIALAVVSGGGMAWFLSPMVPIY